jgi:hypothetical protein
MAIQQEASIATPGFAGFVPSMSSKFGMTFGNAAKEILKTEPYLKKGNIQQEIIRSKMKKQFENEEFGSQSKDAEADLWKKNTYATGDDRFSFPPVPGYTGYIPRSRDNFGRPFVDTTNASLLEFKRMVKSRNTLPPKVSAILKSRRAKEQQQAREPCSNDEKTNLVSSFDPYAKSNSSDFSPYKLPKDHPEKTFINGYTGFVPRIQHHFGEVERSKLAVFSYC